MGNADPRFEVVADGVNGDGGVCAAEVALVEAELPELLKLMQEEAEED